MIFSLTDSETAQEDMEGRLNTGSYFRFNFVDGLQDIRLDERKMKRVDGEMTNVTLTQIKTATEAYLAQQ